MISRPLSRLLLALAVTALLMPSAGAYPEGYPRIDGIRILDEVPFLDPNNHKGVVRTAYNRLTDEYLVAWLTSNGIRGAAPERLRPCTRARRKWRSLATLRNRPCT